jgi:ferredoxin-NADP reductase
VQVSRAGFRSFVCGPLAFVEQVAGDLRELGVPDHRLHAEKF